jgi:hypothetical protein
MTGRRCGGRVDGVSLVESSMNRLPCSGVGRVVLPLLPSFGWGVGVWNRRPVFVGWVFDTLLGPEESGAASGCPGVGLVVSWFLILG